MQMYNVNNYYKMIIVIKLESMPNGEENGKQKST